jgi:hypothetical protein
MVPPVSILRRYQKDVEKIQQLDDATVQALIAALESMPLSVGIDTIVSELVSTVEGIPREELNELIPSLLSLSTIRDQYELTSEEVAQALSKSVGGAESSLLESRLTSLLEVHTLNVIAKAGALSIEQPRLMRGARILTDVRPVFGSKPEAPTAALVVHTLKISYLEDNEYKEFFVTLDADDVGRLSDQLNRANSKAKGLRAWIESTEIDYVDSE